MVGSDAGREDRKKKGNRWTMFFPSRGPSQIRAWIQAVRRVLNAGRVDVKVEEGREQQRRLGVARGRDVLQRVQGPQNGAR